MSNHRANNLTIRTPEGCEFSLLLAGPITRFLAWGIDLLLVVAGSMLVGKVVAVVAIVSRDLAMAVFFLAVFVIWIAYAIVLEHFYQGRTIGKKILRLRVMDERGFRLTFHQVVVRNLLRFVDMLPLLYMLGGLACLFTRSGQRLGDLAANTVVVRTPDLTRPDLTRALGGKYNSLREYPHLAGRLRQRISPQEARIALQALFRRDELDPGARVSLFGEIARSFRSRVRFPQGATEGISDEQYVRNVVDVLYRSRLKQ